MSGKASVRSLAIVDSDTATILESSMIIKDAPDVQSRTRHFASTTSASVLRGERYSAGLLAESPRAGDLSSYEVLQSRLIDASELLLMLMLMLMNQIDVQRSTAPTGHPLFASPMFGVFDIPLKATLCARCSASPCELEFLCRQGTRDRPSPHVRPPDNVHCTVDR